MRSLLSRFEVGCRVAAFALVGWLRWAFNAWKANGLWRAKNGDSPHLQETGPDPEVTQ